jgi:hypothetical protein
MNWDWFTVLNAVAVTFGIIGLPLSIWLYLKSKRERKPRIFELHPRGILFRPSSKGVDAIRVTSRDGTPMTADVVSVQFCFVNAGRESIRKTDIAKEITIGIADPEARILDEPRLISESIPGVNHFRAHLADSRTIELSLQLADFRHGALFHFVYAGDPKASLSINGYVSGSSIKHVYPPKITERLRDQPSEVMAWVLGPIVLAANFVVLVATVLKHLEVSSARWEILALAFAAAPVFLVLSLAIRSSQLSLVPINFKLPPQRGGVR